MGFPGTNHAPAAIVQADSTRIIAVEDRRAEAVRAEVLTLPSDPTHGVRFVPGYYKTPGGGLGYYDGSGLNNWTLYLEEADLNPPAPGTQHIYLYIALGGGFTGSVQPDADWPDGPGVLFNPGIPYAPLAILTLDNGPTGYTGDNSTEKATIIAIADARDWF